MTDGLTYDPGQSYQLPPPTFVPATPTFEPPGLSIRATFLASDGSRPQDIVLEWKHDPGLITLKFALDMIAKLAQPSEVQIVTEQDGETSEMRAGGPTDWARAPTAETEQFARPFCGATGPGHDGEGHACTLYLGHEPAEPGGRVHRCRCGGMFMTEQEDPVVPGRREQDRRRERDR